MLMATIDSMGRAVQIGHHKKISSAKKPVEIVNSDHE
jgi:hypothetical protein